jgi:transcription elongation factor GreA
MADAPETFLTQEAFDRLSADLERMSTTERDEIVARIAAARDEGDLKENSGYHAARDQLGLLEAKIRDLKELLKHAKVGDVPESSGVVEIGTVITATIAGDESRFFIGNREIAAQVEDLDAYSPESPVGKAIVGLKVGDKTSFTAPNGKEISVAILKVETFVP